MSEEVEPDYKHAFKLFKDILLLPVTFFLVLFKKKEFSDLLAPLKDLWAYFWDAKFTAILIIMNFVVFIALAFYMAPMSEEQAKDFMHNYLANGPANFRSLNFIPFFANWFVHAGIAHIVGNMVFLFILGRVVEKNFGALKFGAIYFGAGIVSALFDVFVHFNDLNYYAVGASGAIAGLASAAMLVEPFYLVFVILVPIPVFLLGWLQVYSDMTSVLNPDPTSNVANFAHLGGFFAITILAFFLSSEDKHKLLRGLIINVVTLLVLGGVWFFFLRH
jgi:membrane associated rhomboid family serine protease